MYLTFGLSQNLNQTHLFWGWSPDDPEAQLIHFLKLYPCDYSCTYWLIPPFPLSVVGPFERLGSEERCLDKWMNEWIKSPYSKGSIPHPLCFSTLDHEPNLQPGWCQLLPCHPSPRAMWHWGCVPRLEQLKKAQYLHQSVIETINLSFNTMRVIH